MKLFLNLWVLIFLGTFCSFSDAALENNEAWMGVYIDGKKLGFSYIRLKIEDSETVVHTKVYFRMMSEGVSQSTTLTQETHLSPDLKLKNFVLVQELMGHRQTIKAKIENNNLIFNISSPNFTKIDSIPLPPSITSSSTYFLNIVRSGLKIGKKGKISVLVEPFQMVADLTYEILRKEKAYFKGKQMDVYVVKQNLRGVASTFSVTESGIILREESIKGFKSIREPESVATGLEEGSFPVSRLITLSLIRPQHEIHNPREAKAITLLISGMHSSDLIPKDHRQKILTTKKVTNGRYESKILIESESPLFGKSIQAHALIKNSEHAMFLEASPEVQVNHPEILALSKLLAQEETDLWRLAKIINQWVYDNMDKALLDTVTAVDALRERRGECQSHTYLYTALARAAGIPTKIVNGLVYSQSYGGFLYHAWPEVFVGQWRALDPTLGQDNVDATHIKLTENERENPLGLIPFIGQVDIEVIDLN